MSIRVLGLTGSIGMGKSTTAGFFKERGIPVWDADAAVHRLYAPNGAASAGISKICPTAVSGRGVDRTVLRDWIAKDPGAITRLESVVHPLVAADRHDFIQLAQADGHKLVVVDVPLLFETDGDKAVDAVLVVTAPKDVQKARVMMRDGMTEAHFARILAKQMPDRKKRAQADFVIETTTLAAARQGVDRVLAALDARGEKHA